MIAREPEPAEELRQLTRVVRRLLPYWRDPERFFAERGELEDRLAALARRIEREAS